MRRSDVPLVNIKGISGYLTLDQKKELISKVTDAVLSVEGEGLRQATWVVIEDVPPGAWGVGGQPMSDGDLRRLAGR
nr:4-oxalocrotonate tautomerase family protein [Methylocystis silviterrae]